MSDAVIDWQKIEAEYRAGIRPLRAIAEDHHISEGAIRKRAKRDSWERDLSGKIKARADDLVRREEVRKASTQKLSPVTEKQAVEVNARVQADIILAHRTDIPRKRELVAKLFAEVEAQTDGGDLLEQLTLALQQGDQDKLAEVARKVASLPQRIKGAAELVGAYKTLIGLERQVFGITSDDGDPGPTEGKWTVEFTKA